jgi:hypothetical protein
MKHIVIYTEGVGDINFLADVLHTRFKFDNLERKEGVLRLEKKTDGKVIELRVGKPANDEQGLGSIGAFTDPKQAFRLKKDIQDLILTGKKVLFIIDTDIDIDTQRQKVKTAHESELFKVEDLVFLLPDNATSGHELEHLLHEVSTTPEVFSCWSQLQKCVVAIEKESLGTEKQREKLLRKGAIDLFCDLLEVRRDIVQRKSSKSVPLWDLEHLKMKNLIDFLERHLK